jgi:chromate reductase
MSKKVAIISGSIRKDGYSTQLGQALQPLFPEGYEAEIVEIGQLPLYNQDFDAGTQPESYTAFRQKMAGMDAVLFITPEHNSSIPAALKNALDVGSRPYGHSVWDGKPAAVISNSPGMLGGFGANHHLRQVLTFVYMTVLQQPEAYISKVAELLDGNGGFKSENTRNFAQSIIDAFVEHIDRY